MPCRRKVDLGILTNKISYIIQNLSDFRTSRLVNLSEITAEVVPLKYKI